MNTIHASELHDASTFVVQAGGSLQHQVHSNSDVKPDVVNKQQTEASCTRSRYLVQGRTCVACRLSKVKCNRGTPCDRCVRLGLACVTTAPPQRSAKRRKNGTQVAGKSSRDASIVNATSKEPRLGQDTRAFLAVQPKGNGSEDPDFLTSKEMSTSIATSFMDMSKKEQNDDSGIALLTLLRTWFAIAVRRRSTQLMADCMKLATDSGISMDEIVIAPSQVDGSFTTVNRMGFLADVICVAKEDQKVMGPRMQLEHIPRRLLDATQLTDSGETMSEWIIVHRRSHDGLFSMFLTPAFERDIVDYSVMKHAYETNTQDLSQMIYPEREKRKIGKIIGILHKSLDSTRGPPVVSVRALVKLKDGTQASVDVYVCMLLVELPNGLFDTFHLQKLARCIGDDIDMGPLSDDIPGTMTHPPDTASPGPQQYPTRDNVPMSDISSSMGYAAPGLRRFSIGENILAELGGGRSPLDLQAFVQTGYPSNHPADPFIDALMRDIRADFPPSLSASPDGNTYGTVEHASSPEYSMSDVLPDIARLPQRFNGPYAARNQMPMLSPHLLNPSLDTGDVVDAMALTSQPQQSLTPQLFQSSNFP